MSFKFENEFVQCAAVIVDENGTLHITGNIKQMAMAREVIIHAPNPIDRMTNYTGSGLPFPCAQVAFENTPNFARITEPSGVFNLQFSYPNAYYTTDAHTKIEPSLFVTFYWKEEGKEKTVVRLPLTDGLPLRTLNYRPGHAKGPHYYAVKSDIIGIRGAEATMYALAEAKATYDVA